MKNEGERKEVAISYYKNIFVTGKHILKVYSTYKQNKEKFNTRKLNLTKTIPFISTLKNKISKNNISKNNKTSKQSVGALKKACSKKVSKSKQSHVEKPDANNTLEISEERDNKNALLTTSNCGGDYQLPLSKQQFISPNKTFATNPNFEHFVGSVVSNVVVDCGKKLYFNDSREYKVNSADVTPTNILKPSSANPTSNQYANIRNNNNQTLPEKLLDQSVGLHQLSRFGIFNQTVNALGKCTFPEDGRFKKEIPEKVQQFQIDERFEDLKEISTASGN